MDPDARAMNEPGRIEGLAMAAILLGGFVLRVAGVAFGVSWEGGWTGVWHPDEVTLVVGNLWPDMNPRYHFYPSFHIYLLFCVNALLFGVMTVLSGVVFLMAGRSIGGYVGGDPDTIRTGQALSPRIASLFAVILLAADLMIASWGFNPASDPLLLHFTLALLRGLLKLLLLALKFSSK